MSFTVETLVLWRNSSFNISGGQSGTGTGFSPNTKVLLCQYNFTNALFCHLGYVTRHKI